MVLADWNKIRGIDGGSYSLYSGAYISSPYSLKISVHEGYAFKLTKSGLNNIVDGMIEVWLKTSYGWHDTYEFVFSFGFRSTNYTWSTLIGDPGDGTCSLNIYFYGKVVRYYKQSSAAGFIQHSIYPSIVSSVNPKVWNKWRCIWYTNASGVLVVKPQVLIGDTWQNICDPFTDPENPSGGIVGFAGYFATSDPSAYILVDDMKIYRLTPLS